MIKTATIRILDEVNVIVAGLTQDDYEIMSERFAVYANNYFYDIRFKLEKWDGKIRFFTGNGVTYINLLDEILPLLKKSGYQIKYIDKRMDCNYTIPRIDDQYLADWGVTLGEHQLRAINLATETNNGMIIAGTGAGKAQPLYSKILTPSGWVTNGSLSLGDIVTTPCGSDAKVLGIFPQGITPTYRLRFNDGSEVEASDNHLWNVWLSEKESFDINQMVKSRVPKKEFTLTTLQLIQYLESVKTLESDKTVSIKACSPLEFGNDDGIILDPYMLGALIGDGHIVNQVGISSTDEEVLNKIRSVIGKYGDYSVKHISNYDYRITKVTGRFGKKHNEIKERLVSLGLFGKYSYEKFIPIEYKTATMNTRFELVRGLMDTDGYVDKKGKLSFSTTSMKLAEDFTEVVRSLGAIASIKSKTPTYTYNGERRNGRISYTVSFSSANNADFVSVSRKRERCFESSRRSIRLNKNLTNVEFIGNIETQCIYIDHPTHLYVTDGFTATHNTMITAVLCDLYVTYAHAKMIVIVPNIDLVGQTAAELRDYDLEVGVYSGSEKSLKENIIVSTWQSLQNNKVIMGQFDGVIVDECHGVTGKQLQDILNQYGKHMQIRIGMTGTLPKSPVDLMTIKVCLGEVLITVPASELIANGWLAGLHINMYRLDEDFSDEWKEFQELKKKEGRPEWDHIVDLKSYEAYRFPDYDAEKNFLLKNSIRRTFLADYIENLRGNRKGNTFVLVSSVPAGKKLAKLIDGAFFVYGQDKTVVRKKIYKLFDDNDNIVVISTFQLASTGLNIKRIFNLVFVDAGKSFTKIIQAIGRGLRKAADKDFVNVYDFFSGLKYAKKHAGQRKSYYKEQQYDHTLKKITYAQYYKDVD